MVAYAAAVAALNLDTSSANQNKLIAIKQELCPLIDAAGYASTELLTELTRTGKLGSTEADEAQVHDAIVNLLACPMWSGEQDGGKPGNIAIISTEHRPGQLAKLVAQARAPRARRSVVVVADEDRQAMELEGQAAQQDALDYDQKADRLEAEATRMRQAAGKRRHGGAAAATKANRPRSKRLRKLQEAAKKANTL